MRFRRQRNRFGDAAINNEPAKHEWGTQPEMFGPRHLHRLDLILSELRSLPSSSRSLDAACGLGQLAGRVKAAGHRAFGLDGEIAAARHAHRAGVPVVVGDMNRLPFRDAMFDAVTCGETLEHLDDDRAAARELARVMRAGARIVITVPAVRALWTASDDYYDHRRRYSRRELEDVVGGAQLHVDRATFWGFPFTLIYDTLFLLPMNRRRARKGSLPAVAAAGRRRSLVAIARAILSLDRLFRFIPFGPGLLLVATKR
jgi:SAM-dependent methyltransferase